MRFGASHLSLCRIDVKGCAGYVAVQRRNKLIVKEHNGQDENISVWSPLSVAGFFFFVSIFFFSQVFCCVSLNIEEQTLTIGCMFPP